MAANDWARRVTEEKGRGRGILAPDNTTGCHVRIRYEFGSAALAVLLE